jgi:photosystem II stability/assembly factor-like uncharacterized protein
MIKKFLPFLTLSLGAAAFAQFQSGAPQYPVTSEGPLADVLSTLRPRSLGPSNMAGRIMDIAVDESDPRVFYTATASGGLWKTENGGISHTPVFDYGGSVSMGAVAISKSNPKVLYVGTGEQSSRNSTAWGDGVYKSVDGGKTWKHIGLTDTRHISKIIVHPKNPDIVYVAATGRLWGRSPERGIYMSKDGGKTWAQIFTQGERAGIIDLDMDPNNPNVLFASAWDRWRRAYVFSSGGMDSGLFKSTDGGKSWRKVTKGLPSGDLGRIGVNIWGKNSKVMVATVEYRVPGSAVRVSSEEMDDDNDRRELREANIGQGGSIPGSPVQKQEPKKQDTTKKEPPKKVDTRFTGVPQDAQMNGGGLFISKDGGESWELVKQINPRPFYFSTPLIDPNNMNRIYVCGMNLHRSEDGGQKWTSVAPNTIHADHHAIWVNPKDSNHVIIGSDGGVYTSRDGGSTWAHSNNMPIGQFYAVSFDGQIPYNVYGGLQDNGSWMLPTQHPRGGVGPWDAVSLNGGDGFYSEADTIESEWVYSESQGGAVARLNRKTGQRRSIRPSLTGERLRFNWNTPIHISPHDNKTIYVGSNRLMKSTNRGDSWTAISPDLTTNNPIKIATIEIAKVLSVNAESTGAENHCTIVTIDESRLEKGRIATGSDDGLVNLTFDGGETWTDVTSRIPGVPDNTWVSRVTWSKWNKDRLYVCFDGHRNNDFKSYVYVSEDAGKTFRSIGNGLPDWDSVYVIREGEKNPNLLILGSEMSLRFSIDLGKSWSRLRGSFPTVAVHDVRVHPKMNDLVVGTHGRAIWTIDITALEGMGGSAPVQPKFLGTSPAIQMPFVSGNPLDGELFFNSPNTQPFGRIYYYLPADLKGGDEDVINITTADGRQYSVASGESVPRRKGVNMVRWSPRIDGLTAPAGTYKVEIKIGKDTMSGTLEVLAPKGI